MHILTYMAFTLGQLGLYTQFTPPNTHRGMLPGWLSNNLQWQITLPRRNWLITPLACFFFRCCSITATVQYKSLDYITLVVSLLADTDLFYPPWFSDVR